MEREIQTEWVRREDGTLEEQRVEITEGSCPNCEADMTLIAMTDSWITHRDGRRVHSGYAEPGGECQCCGAFIKGAEVIFEKETQNV